MAPYAFALDLNEKYTRMGYQKERRKIIEVTSLGQIATIPGYFETMNDRLAHEQAALIMQLKKNLRIKKKHVHVVIPDAYTYSRVIEMPRLREKELVAAIRYQADEFIPMPIDDTYLDLEVLFENKKANKLLVLIVASSKKIVDYVYKTIELAKLVPESLENELSVTGRLFSDLITLEPGANIVVNIGNSGTSIYLTTQSNHLLIHTTRVKIGLNLFYKYLKINLNWDENQIETALKKIGLTQTSGTNGVDITKIMVPLLKELMDEIDKTILVAKNTYGSVIKKIYVYNMNTHITGINQYIQNHTSLPTENLPITNALKENIIVKNFAQEITSFCSVIGANYR